MKKFWSFGLMVLCLASLSGCESITRAIRGDDYVNAKIAASSSEAAASASASASASSSKAYQKELKKALSADQSAFPQLSTDVANDEAEVIMHTSMGDITLKLFPKYAPLAVENFLTHAKDGYYDGLLFHRVISDFMIQSGDPNGDGTGGQSIWNGKDKSIDSGNGFVNEISPYLYNIRGALAMANAGADTNGSQFFINQNSDDQSSQLKRIADQVIFMDHGEVLEVTEKEKLLLKIPASEPAERADTVYVNKKRDKCSFHMTIYFVFLIYSDKGISVSLIFISAFL